MDEQTRELVKECFTNLDARFKTTWQIPWNKALKMKKEHDSYTDLYPNTDWTKGGLIQLCRPSACDFILACNNLAEREVLLRKMHEKIA